MLLIGMDTNAGNEQLAMANRQWPMGMVGNGMEAEQRKAIKSWRKSSASHFQKLQTRCVEQSAGIEHVENFERNNFTRLNSLRGND